MIDNAPKPAEHRQRAAIRQRRFAAPDATNAGATSLSALSATMCTAF